MKLDEWFEMSAMPKTVFARRIGVNPGTVYHWVNGTSFPRYEQIVKIEKLTEHKVTCNDLFKAQIPRKTSKD